MFVASVIAFSIGDTVEGIALAIAAVPEGLPIVATITLAIGMNKMVKNNVLVRRLSAVETLGPTTTICSDKTGTITENQMTLSEIYLFGNKIKITGTGYKPKGNFFMEDNEKIPPDLRDNISLFLKSASLCSNAVINYDKKNDIWKALGDPTEGALVSTPLLKLLRKEE